MSMWMILRIRLLFIRRMLLDLSLLKIKAQIECVSAWLVRPRVKETSYRARGFVRADPGVR
jgi:hypothetical protein